MLSQSLYQILRGGEIRLLTIRSQSNFTLENAYLRDDPHYVAISYCWGDIKDLSNVRVNDYEVQLRGHVCSMLSNLYHKHQVTRVWLDMVCINQNDSDEKSEQVPIMGEIYSRATSVYAWLGEADRQIDYVFDILQEFRDHKRETKFPTHFDAAEQLSYHRQLFRDIYQEKAGTLPEQSDLDDDILHEEFNWIRPLYVRPYWRRVWIVQELVLAKAVVVCCGGKSIDFDDIYGLSLDWGSFEQGFDTGTYQKLKPHTRGWSTIQAIRGHRRRKEVEWEMGGEAPCVMNIGMPEWGDVAMFDEVIGIYAQHHECSLPKDKVYGVRELVPQWKENLVVNYERSDLEVFSDVAKLDLFEPKKHGGWHIAFRLWLAMGLGDRGEFNDCLRQSFPEIYCENEPQLRNQSKRIKCHIGCWSSGAPTRSPRIPLTVRIPDSWWCGNDLSNDDVDDSDGHDSLYSLFSDELNLTDTESSLEDNPTRQNKKLAKETDPASERSRAGDSPDIFIVLNDDVSAVNMSGPFSPHGSKRELETHKGFDEKFPKPTDAA